ncbi:MAG: Xaa-Pro peptidase family protein [Acidobacteriota bacterium]
MSHAPADALSRRHQTVREASATRSLDALVITSLPNILYLTNFTGSSAIVVLTADRLRFITDFRYVTAVTDAVGTAAECPGLELITVDGSYDATLATMLQSMPSSRVGFEAGHLTVGRYDWLKTTMGKGDSAPALVSTEGVVERARARKDAYELRTLTIAAGMLSRVVPGAIEEVRRGRTEREVAHAIDERLRREGFDKTAFDTIVAAGPNSALPHAHPGERRIIENDLVVLDFGGVYDSYCVDLTRTVSVGPADSRAREVYAAVLAAHDKAIEAVRPGASRFAIDAAARDELTRRGLGAAFGHGTGHGLGIEVHEDPRVGRRRAEEGGDDEMVVAGMVFTIEPGAYLPGWGGVRIEDDVVVTETGVDLLTTSTTELIEI